MRRNVRGSATVELALVLPLLMLLFAVAVDFARVYQHQHVATEAARHGALYAADVYVQQNSDYNSAEEAALAHAELIRDTATVAVLDTTDALGNPCVRVTVTCTFHPQLPLPGIHGDLTVSRAVEMRVRPVLE